MYNTMMGLNNFNFLFLSFIQTLPYYIILRTYNDDARVPDDD